MSTNYYHAKISHCIVDLKPLSTFVSFVFEQWILQSDLFTLISHFSFSFSHLIVIGNFPAFSAFPTNCKILNIMKLAEAPFFIGIVIPRSCSRKECEHGFGYFLGKQL